MCWVPVRTPKRLVERKDTPAQAQTDRLNHLLDQQAPSSRAHPTDDPHFDQMMTTIRDAVLNYLAGKP